MTYSFNAQTQITVRRDLVCLVKHKLRYKNYIHFMVRNRLHKMQRQHMANNKNRDQSQKMHTFLQIEITVHFMFDIFHGLYKI